MFPISQAERHFNRQENQELSSALSNFRAEHFSYEEDRFFKLLLSFWTTTLQSRETDRNRRINLAKDAEALSYLAVLNNRLRGVGWRAVYVTGATNIVEASFAEIPRSIIQMAPEVLSDFGNRFVRHIWAYTSDALVEPLNKGKFLIGLMDYLLSGPRVPNSESNI